MQVDVPIQLPSQLEDEIRKTIASVIIEGAKQATNLYYDLPPYPNKSQLTAGRLNKLNSLLEEINEEYLDASVLELRLVTGNLNIPIRVV